MRFLKMMDAWENGLLDELRKLTTKLVELAFATMII